MEVDAYYQISMLPPVCNDASTPETYTLALPVTLPISVFVMLMLPPVSEIPVTVNGTTVLDGELFPPVSLIALKLPTVLGPVSVEPVPAFVVKRSPLMKPPAPAALYGREEDVN